MLLCYSAGDKFNDYMVTNAIVQSDGTVLWLFPALIVYSEQFCSNRNNAVEKKQLLRNYSAVLYQVLIAQLPVQVREIGT